MTRCDFCRYPALGRFEFDEGCIAFPGLVNQTLCLHHAVRAQPCGGMELVEDFTIDGSFRRFYEQGLY